MKNYEVRNGWLIKKLNNSEEQAIRVSSIVFYRIGRKDKFYEYNGNNDYMVRFYTNNGQYLEIYVRKYDDAKDLIQKIMEVVYGKEI